MTDKQLSTSLTPELYCSNSTKSLAFYIETLGFKIQYQRVEEGFAMLERQGARIMLDELINHSDKRLWINAPMERPFGRGINLEIQTTHIEALYTRCQQNGAPIFLPMEEKWYQADTHEIGNQQFIVLDPDGYMLRFTQSLGTRART